MRLLHRTIISYLVFSVILVLVAIPVFYVIIHKMFMNDVDEALYQRRKELVYRLNKNPGSAALKSWQDLDGNTEIKPFSGTAHRDSIYNIDRYDSVNRETTTYRELSTVIRVNQRPYLVLLRLSLVDSEDLAQGIVTTQVILLAALLAGLLLLSRWQSKKLWRPFYRTLDHLQKFELGASLPIQLDQTRIREFSDLNREIKQLTGKNLEVYLQQKEFTENAAHEMQTPLAVFQSQLDLLLQNKNLDHEQAERIQSLSAAMQRLAGLNKSLLLLAKIENRQFIETTDVDIIGLTEKILGQFEEQIASKEIAVNTEFKEAFIVHASPELMEILLSNLLSNAVRHNDKGGTILIRASAVRFTIENTGAPLSFDASRIFDRFRKGSASKDSVGLGLAIVKKICEAAGLEVEYIYEMEKHIFSLRKPLPISFRIGK